MPPQSLQTFQNNAPTHRHVPGERITLIGPSAASGKSAFPIGPSSGAFKRSMTDLPKQHFTLHDFNEMNCTTTNFTCVNSTTSSTTTTISGIVTPTVSGAVIYSNTTSHNGTFMGTPTPFVTGGSEVVKGCGAVLLAGLLVVGMAVAL